MTLIMVKVPASVKLGLLSMNLRMMTLVIGLRFFKPSLGGVNRGLTI